MNCIQTKLRQVIGNMYCIIPEKYQNNISTPSYYSRVISNPSTRCRYHVISHDRPPWSPCQNVNKHKSNDWVHVIMVDVIFQFVNWHRYIIKPLLHCISVLFTCICMFLFWLGYRLVKITTYKYSWIKPNTVQ